MCFRAAVGTASMHIGELNMNKSCRIGISGRACAQATVAVNERRVQTGQVCDFTDLNRSWSVSNCQELQGQNRFFLLNEASKQIHS